MDKRYTAELGIAELTKALQVIKREMDEIERRGKRMERRRWEKDEDGTLLYPLAEVYLEGFREEYKTLKRIATALENARGTAAGQAAHHSLSRERESSTVPLPGLNRQRTAGAGFFAGENDGGTRAAQTSAEV